MNRIYDFKNVQVPWMCSEGRRTTNVDYFLVIRHNNPITASQTVARTNCCDFKGTVYILKISIHLV